MKKIKFILLFLSVALGLVFFLGPRPHYPAFDGELPLISCPLDELDSIVDAREASVLGFKPDNQARVIWADSIRKTAFSIVYLHGFGASPMEGAPAHQDFAARYHCNLYLPRLPQHGIDDPEAFRTIGPKDSNKPLPHPIENGC